jgi:hypothetical protein
MMNTMTNMFMVFKMINIYWFVSNSNEMVRQRIDKYTNVRHNMQVMTGLVCLTFGWKHLITSYCQHYNTKELNSFQNKSFEQLCKFSHAPIFS